VVSGDEIDPPAADLTAIIPRAGRASDAEVSEKVQNVIGLRVGVEPVKNSLIHLLDIGEGTSAIADDIGVPEMEVRSEPNVGNGIR